MSAGWQKSYSQLPSFQERNQFLYGISGLHWLADLLGQGLNCIQFEPFELLHKYMNIYDEYINIAKLIIHTSYSTFTVNIISQQAFNHKENFLIKFLDNNHTISQFLDIKISTSGVFCLNTIVLINSSDTDMSTNNISIHNYT